MVIPGGRTAKRRSSVRAEGRLGVLAANLTAQRRSGRRTEGGLSRPCKGPAKILRWRGWPLATTHAIYFLKAPRRRDISFISCPPGNMAGRYFIVGPDMLKGRVKLNNKPVHNIGQYGMAGL